MRDVDYKLIIERQVPISAFIFHTSRCGSTLFAKALAREPSNLLSIQPAPLQYGFWAAMTDGFQKPLKASEDNLDAFRGLVALLTRKRQRQHKRVFIKFISWNVLYLDFITKAFPDVPAIYLYRDPVEIVASVRRSATAILEAKGQKLAEFLTGMSRQEINQFDPTSYLATCYARAFKTVTAWEDQKLSLLNYPELTAAAFPDILKRGLGYKPTLTSLARMLPQFGTYSKDDSNAQLFATDSATKRSTISDDDRQRISRLSSEAFTTLKNDPRNLSNAPVTPRTQSNVRRRNETIKLPEDRDQPSTRSRVDEDITE